MADYTAQEGHNYGPRSTSYGHASNFQRDAAFQNIFGGAPPPGRSQTMTSEPPSMPQERANTFTSQPSPGMVPRGPPPVRHMQNGYDRGFPNGAGPPQSQMNGHPQRQGPGGMGQQGPPLPSFPDRRPYPQPQRIDSRPGAPIPPYTNKPIPNRVPAPALNADAYRSRSMARLGGLPLYGPPPGSFQQGSANAFRQQPYNAVGPRITSQGRQIPERPDERAMTMSSYMSERDQSQLTTGRVIPGRRRESASEPDSLDLGTSSISPVSFNTSSSAPYTSISSHARRPSDGSIPGRNMSSPSIATTLVNERSDSMQSRSQLQHTPSVATSVTMTTSRRTPMVYPALLSRVADVFQANIGVGEKTKNDLSYKNAFNGAEAVDLIAYIIRTTDRNLALLLGRALDAQKFFHDVTYDHRLRDASGEVYQFRETMGEEATSKEVNGVFTLLTECYSPTCTRDHLCYSIACPRRLEQQARLNLKPEPGLRHQSSKGSLHGNEDDEQKLWINSVPKEVAASTDDREKKRQEVISEIMYTERDFVKDLEYLRDFWMRPLRAANPTQSSPIPEHRREKFYSNCVFKLLGNSCSQLQVR
jgi:RHO1 GDP-GTP exchange protein 1/2